jgi:soluble lytic murein transglycosylase-like protein
MSLRRALLLLALLPLGACALAPRPEPAHARLPTPQALPPGATPQMMALVEQAAAELQIPAELIHRVIQRESDYNPAARNGPYWGLMQILPETARTMGFRGDPQQLLDPATNLRYAGRYLRGAWIVADGDMDEAVGWYARGFYFEARDRGLLVETGLSDRELR